MFIIIGKKSFQQYQTSIINILDLFRTVNTIIKDYKLTRTEQDFIADLVNGKEKILGMDYKSMIAIRKLYDSKGGVQPITPQSIEDIFINGNNKLPEVKVERSN